MKINSFVFYSVYESFDRADKNILKNILNQNMNLHKTV